MLPGCLSPPRRARPAGTREILDRRLNVIETGFDDARSGNPRRFCAGISVPRVKAVKDVPESITRGGSAGSDVSGGCDAGLRRDVSDRRDSPSSRNIPGSRNLPRNIEVSR